MNQKQIYEKSAEKEFSKTLYPYYGHWRTRKIVLELMKKDGLVLDLGCGDGIFLKQGEVGIDISRKRLERARQKTERLIEGDAQNTPFKNKSFNSILCTELLEHVPDYLKTLKEIHRTLKDDGQAIITIPIAGLYRTILARLGKTLYLDPKEHLREWSRYKAKGFTDLKQFYEDTERTGFKIEKVYGSSVPELPFQDWVLKNKVLRSFFSRIEDLFKNNWLKFLGRKLIFILKKA